MLIRLGQLESEKESELSNFIIFGRYFSNVTEKSDIFITNNNTLIEDLNTIIIITKTCSCLSDLANLSPRKSRS